MARTLHFFLLCVPARDAPRVTLTMVYFRTRYACSSVTSLGTSVRQEDHRNCSGGQNPTHGGIFDSKLEFSGQRGTFLSVDVHEI
jgi:hypothetical protein